MTTLEDLKQQVEELNDNSSYTKAANLVTKVFNIKLKVLDKGYRKYFKDDRDARWVFKMVISRDKKRYTFTFGQSIAAADAEPTIYDILTCLTKYDPGSFEDFCSDFGYDEDSRSAEKTYKDVVKEYKAMRRLFTEEELEVLSYIN